MTSKETGIQSLAECRQRLGRCHIGRYSKSFQNRWLALN